MDFTLTAATKERAPFGRFAAEVPVGASGTGLAAFAARYLDSLLCFGNAVGEIVLDHSRERIAWLYLPPLAHLSFLPGESPLEAVICTARQAPPALPCPELVLFTALHPAPGEITGQSLLSGLPALSRVLLQIYSAIGKNFERMGNLRYAVTYRPAAGDQTDAAAVAAEISREWSAAMQAAAAERSATLWRWAMWISGSSAPITSLSPPKSPSGSFWSRSWRSWDCPPFLLGLSWSSTERMSSQQSDLLTGELEAYRRLLTPVLAKTAGLYLRTEGFSPAVTVECRPSACKMKPRKPRHA